MTFSLSGRQPEDQADLVGKNINEDLNNLSFAQVITLLQFFGAASVTIFAVVGVSVNQPVGHLLLLALLQFIITIPGFLSYFTRKRAHFQSYVAFQVVTLVSELIWLIYSISTRTHNGVSVTILSILIFMQTLAILAATLFKDVVVNLQDMQISRKRSYERRNGESPEEGITQSSTESPPSLYRRKSTSSIRDTVHAALPESSSLRPRGVSKDTEEGIDRSIRGTHLNRRGNRSASKDSLRKFKESRRKMRRLAKQLRQTRKREKALTSESSCSDKVMDGSFGRKASTDLSTKGTQSSDITVKEEKSLKEYVPIGTPIERVKL